MSGRHFEGVGAVGRVVCLQRCLRALFATPAGVCADLISTKSHTDTALRSALGEVENEPAYHLETRCPNFE